MYLGLSTLLTTMLLLTAMAEGNGEVSVETKDIKLEPDSYVERTADYPKLIDYGLDKKVAAKLDEIYRTGEISFQVCITSHSHSISSSHKHAAVRESNKCINMDHFLYIYHFMLLFQVQAVVGLSKRSFLSLINTSFIFLQSCIDNVIVFSIVFRLIMLVCFDVKYKCSACIRIGFSYVS